MTVGLERASMRSKGSRARAWGLYFAAWIPVGPIYANLISRGKPLSFNEAINIGVDYALIPSLLGIVVWWITGQLRWPTTRRALFFALQPVFAIAYSVLWLVLIVGTIAAFTGFSTALTIAKTF